MSTVTRTVLALAAAAGVTASAHSGYSKATAGSDVLTVGVLGGMVIISRIYSLG